MKRTLFRILNLLMAVVVLLSSTGFGLIEHSCHMRGRKITHVGTEQIACAGCPSVLKQSIKTGPTISKTDCCEEEQRYENVPFGSSLSQLVAKFFKAVTETLVAGVSLVVSTLVSWLFATNESIVIHAANAPPPAYGRTLLAFVQSFLI